MVKSVFHAAASWVPSLYWVPKYTSWTYFQDDLIAGLTLSAVVIPQSLAYSSLASLPPVYGLYVALVPPLLYTFLGTTPYNSLGTMAILSILIAESLALVDGIVSKEQIAPLRSETLHVLVAVFMCFLVGLGQLLIAVTGFGKFLSRHVFRHSFVSAFTSGSAVTILTSQLKPFFGFTIPKYNGLFSTPMSWYYVITHMHTLHGTTLAVGSISVLLIVGIRRLEIGVRKWVLKRQAKKDANSFDSNVTPITVFPEVLFTVTVVTLCTTALQVSNNHGLPIIGHIPSGLPPLTLPWDLLNRVDQQTASAIMTRLIPGMISIILVSTVLLTSILTAFPTPVLIRHLDTKSEQSLDVSRTLTFRSQYLSNTEPPINQEIFAVAVSSVISSFFSCFSPTASLSKAAILAGQTNVRSPLGNFFSVIVVAISVSFLATWFENIPMAVLAAIIIVAIVPVACRASLFFQLIQKALEAKKPETEDIDMKKKAPLEIPTSVPPDHREPPVLSSDPISAKIKEEEGIDMALGDGVFIVKDVNQPIETTDSPPMPTKTTAPHDASEQTAWHKAARGCRNWCDVVVWLLTFLPVVLLDVGTGIYTGLGVVILIKCIEVVLEWILNRNPAP